MFIFGALLEFAFVTYVSSRNFYRSEWITVAGYGTCMIRYPFQQVEWTPRPRWFPRQLSSHWSFLIIMLVFKKEKVDGLLLRPASKFGTIAKHTWRLRKFLTIQFNGRINWEKWYLCNWLSTRSHQQITVCSGGCSHERGVDSAAGLGWTSVHSRQSKVWSLIFILANIFSSGNQPAPWSNHSSNGWWSSNIFATSSTSRINRRGLI